MFRKSRNASLFILVPVLLILLWYYRTSRYSLVVISGESMFPALQSGETWVVDKFKQPEKNDIIVFNNEGQVMVKRIYIMPLDHYWVTEQLIIDSDINGNLTPSIERTYVEDGELARKALSKTNLYKLARLDSDEYVVLGDNLPGSEDSRMYGPIYREQIIGVLVNKI